MISGRLTEISQAIENIYVFILAYRLGEKEVEPVVESAAARFVVPGHCTGNVIGCKGAFTKLFRIESVWRSKS
jgi:hypothetical protein